MREIKYYCDHCKKEIKDYKTTLTENYQHGDEYVQVMQLLQCKGITHIHFDCMKNLKNKIDEVLNAIS